MANGKRKKESDAISNLDIAQFLHSQRSPKSRAVDNGTSARIVDPNSGQFARWVFEPNRFDIKGVDTVKGRVKKPTIKKKSKAIIKKRYGVTVG